MSKKLPPKKRLSKKLPPKKLQVKVVTVAQLAERTLRALDSRLAVQSAKRSGSRLLPETKALKELNLVEDGELVPKAVHAITPNACWRPDLFLDAGRYCDNCGLYKYCKASIKRLKSVSSQPRDGNPTLQQAETAARIAEDEEDFGAVVVATPPPLEVKLRGFKVRKKTIKLLIR